MNLRFLLKGLRQVIPGLAVVLAAAVLPCGAQDLEPRRWSHLPVGVSVFGGAYSYTEADIAFDPVLLIEDVEMDLHAVGVKYVHAFELFGKSARVDLTQGYADAKWSGLLDGVSASTSRIGFTDTTLRVAMQFFGAPPLKGKEFKSYRAAVADCETILGVGLAVQLPTGHYEEDRLLNIGNNRYIFRPQLGVVHTRGKLSMELTGSAWLFTDNDDFYGGNDLENDPLYTLQGYVVYTFRPGLWVGAGVAYGAGRESTLNGVDKDDRRETLLWGVSLGVPINPRLGAKIGYLWRETQEETGADSGTVAVGFSYLW